MGWPDEKHGLVEEGEGGNNVRELCVISGAVCSDARMCTATGTPACGRIQIAWGLSVVPRSDSLAPLSTFPVVDRIDLGVRRALIGVCGWIVDVLDVVTGSGRCRGRNFVAS